jgi:hypothetical protein
MADHRATVTRSHFKLLLVRRRNQGGGTRPRVLDTPSFGHNRQGDRADNMSGFPINGARRYENAVLSLRLRVV